MQIEYEVMLANAYNAGWRAAIKQAVMVLSIPAVHDQLHTYSYRKGFDDGRRDAMQRVRDQ